jgi:hypothetical protein
MSGENNFEMSKAQRAVRAGQPEKPANLAGPVRSLTMVRCQHPAASGAEDQK